MTEVCNCCRQEKETVEDREDVYAKNVLKKIILNRMCKECFEKEWEDVYNELMDTSL